MEINDIVREWLDFADMDLEAAEHLYKTMNKMPLEIICYHCQQSGEKYLKAVIISYNIDPPKIHDLNQLLKLCENCYDSNFDEILEECDRLRSYAIQPRYPLEIHIEEYHVKQALKDAEKIREFIKNILQK